MALFKISRGPESRLNNEAVREGYAWFTEDEHNLYIDIGNEPGDRVQVNAYAADVLLQRDETGAVVKEIDIDDLLLKDIVAGVKQGGTGRDSLTANAVLVGNGTNPVKLISGTGALFTDTDGEPQFGTLPVEHGGTGAATAAGARSKLDVYNKNETNEKVDDATTLAYAATLNATEWVEQGSKYVYNYENTSLKCGKNGNVPPIVTYTSNQAEYSKISSDETEATPGVGITFVTAERPTSNIGIIVIDVK